MTDSEILKKAIEKAEKNGYVIPILEKEVLTFRLSREYGKNNSITLWTNGWIISHDFAKAFWGTEKICLNCLSSEVVNDRYNEWDCSQCGRTDVQKAWQYHLQQMVLEENPISYLKKFI